jgi:hypothetical protein
MGGLGGYPLQQPSPGHAPQYLGMPGPQGGFPGQGMMPPQQQMPLGGSPYGAAPGAQAGSQLPPRPPASGYGGQMPLGQPGLPPLQPQQALPGAGSPAVGGMGVGMSPGHPAGTPMMPMHGQQPMGYSPGYAAAPMGVTPQQGHSPSVHAFSQQPSPHFQMQPSPQVSLHGPPGALTPNGSSPYPYPGGQMGSVPTQQYHLSQAPSPLMPGTAYSPVQQQPAPQLPAYGQYSPAPAPAPGPYSGPSSDYGRPPPVPANMPTGPPPPVPSVPPPPL